MKEIDKNKESNVPKFRFLIITAVVIIGIWIITPLVIYNLIDNPNERGTFGDLYGGLNALFSGLAFSGIIFTILLQRSELKLQREELRDTRQELKRSADAQEKTEIAFNKQVEVMNKTAMINGLSTIVDYYKSMEEGESYDISKKHSYKRKKDETTQRIIKILNSFLLEEDSDEHKINE